MNSPSKVIIREEGSPRPGGKFEGKPSTLLQLSDFGRIALDLSIRVLLAYPLGRSW